MLTMILIKLLYCKIFFNWIIFNSNNNNNKINSNNNLYMLLNNNNGLRLNKLSNKN